LLFTPFNQNNQAKFTIGYAATSILMFNLLVLTLVIVVSLLRSMKSKGKKCCKNAKNKCCPGEKKVKTSELYLEKPDP
jgi:hypothetical protein